MNETEAVLPIQEMRAFERELAEIPKEIREPVLLEIGEAIVGEAQFNAPVKTGHLAESHYTSDFKRDRVIIGVNYPYAMAVHETHPTKSRWFIRAIMDNFARVSEAALKRAFENRGGA